MIKYMRSYDNEIFDEEELPEAVDDLIDDDELVDALMEIDPFVILKHLDEDTRMRVYEVAYESVLANHFYIVEDDDD